MTCPHTYFDAAQDDFRLQVEQKEATILQLNDKLRLAHAGACRQPARSGAQSERRARIRLLAPRSTLLPCGPYCQRGSVSRGSSLSDVRAEREEMQREKDQIINDRETEIEQLEKKMEDMSQEFADMLKVRRVCLPVFITASIGVNATIVCTF